MSDPFHDPSERESADADLNRIDEIDRVCDQFEREWIGDARPRLEAFVSSSDRPGQLDLLRELLVLELEYRRKVGESPSMDEYAARFPLYAEAIRDLFPPPDAVAGSSSVEHQPLTDKRKLVADSPVAGSSTNSCKRPGLPHTTRICNYELIEEIARGGMGVVYKARQLKPDRIVAVKMILSGELASEEEIRRFEAEVHAAANLRHPNIVTIYEVGHEKGQHFFSMAFMDGPSLAQRLARGPIAPDEAARVIKTVAEAVEFAHSQGIVHLDLKPANILFDRAGIPHITDFGLVRRIDDAHDLTATGQVLGTPSFIPPEQALNRSNEIGVRSDVYSLGAVLYMALTGRPPFQAATPFETIRQVLEVNPAPPRLVNPDVPRDLEAVCLKCLRKKPDGRYASAAELIDDLQRYLDHKPVRARTELSSGAGSRRSRARMWTGLSMAFVALLVIGFFWVLPKTRPSFSRRYTVTDLGTLGGVSSSANGINASGQVVGTSTTANHETRAFLYSDGVMIDLGTLGGSKSVGVAINAAGQVAGESLTSDGQYHAFLYSGGSLKDLGTLGGVESRARGISDTGTVVGQFYLPPGYFHGFLYDGTMHELGDLRGNQSAAFGINASGQIVGTAESASGMSQAFLYSDGVMHGLGTLGGNRSFATCINSKGQMAGYSSTRDNAAEHACLFTRTTITDLDSLFSRFAQVARMFSSSVCIWIQIRLVVESENRSHD